MCILSPRYENYFIGSHDPMSKQTLITVLGEAYVGYGEGISHFPFPCIFFGSLDFLASGGGYLSCFIPLLTAELCLPC